MALSRYSTLRAVNIQNLLHRGDRDAQLQRSYHSFVTDRPLWHQSDLFSPRVAHFKNFLSALNFEHAIARIRTPIP